jgi:hypothetical protein
MAGAEETAGGLMVPCADAASRAENLDKKGTNPGAGGWRPGRGMPQAPQPPLSRLEAPLPRWRGFSVRASQARESRDWNKAIGEFTMPRVRNIPPMPSNTLRVPVPANKASKLTRRASRSKQSPAKVWSSYKLVWNTSVGPVGSGRNGRTGVPLRLSAFSGRARGSHDVLGN